MFPQYFSFLMLNFLCWSHSVLSSGEKLHAPQAHLENVGEPLILTPYIKSNNTAAARNLSSVVPFFSNSIVSHAGYLTVNETYNSNLFFWFFCKNGEDWKNAPLLLWLQGGPGASSLIGLFNENGPYVYTQTGLQLRNISWTTDYNVLYIDQPVGTGFSFTESPKGYISTQDEVGDNLYEALIQFFKLFPELGQNAFYITGESYAGKYIPAIGRKIHSMKIANLSNINLKGLFMVSALTDGLLNGLGNFCFQAGIIDYDTKIKLEGVEKFLEISVRDQLWGVASKSESIIFGKIKLSSDVNVYDYRKHLSSEEEGKEFVEFLQLSDVRMKMHVGNRTYNYISVKVYDSFEEDRAKSVVNWVGELLRNYPIAFVGGQYDVRTAHPLVVNVLQKLELYQALYYRTTITRNRFIVDGIDAGYYTSRGRLTDILVRGAGHMVPKDQPRAALVALHRFINNLF